MTQIEINVIRTISQLERLENVMVDDTIIREYDTQKDVCDEDYVINVHKADSTADNITYIQFSISVNPINRDEPIELVDEVENVINGFDLSQICIVENLDDYNQMVEDAVGPEDWGAISYVYEVYSEEF